VRACALAQAALSSSGREDRVSPMFNVTMAG
jgi:hypothetical protein